MVDEPSSGKIASTFVSFKGKWNYGMTLSAGTLDQEAFIPSEKNFVVWKCFHYEENKLSYK